VQRIEALVFFNPTNRFGVFIATEYTNEVCRSGVRIPGWKEIFLTYTTCRPSLRPTECFIQSYSE
jgi:hypothetical protein